MNYSKMSDFEINARAHFGGMKDFKVSGEYCSFIGPEGDTYGIGPYHYKKNLPDYCNSWADAGPIIDKHKIDLIWYELDACWGAYKGTLCGYGKSPLRAAMIVYLMMKEGE